MNEIGVFGLGWAEFIVLGFCCMIPVVVAIVALAVAMNINRSSSRNEHREGDDDRNED